MKTKAIAVCGLLAVGSWTTASAVEILAEDFNSGIPAGWTIVDNIDGPTWGVDGDALNEEGNWTGGTGTAASISSDEFGTSAYDSELWSSSFSLAGYDSASLDFLTNYQALGSTPTSDNFDVDISIDGGGSWSSLFAFENDTGGFRVADGVAVNLDLAAYLGEADVTIRWHYYNPSTSAFDWYAQIDDVLISGELSPMDVPEPASLALIALGLIGFGLARRRVA